MTKCVVCGQRPARIGAYCASCDERMQRQNKGKNGGKPVKFLHYQGKVAGLVPNGKGGYSTIAVSTSLASLPKSKVLDLDRYCEGYSREIIKRFKAAIATVCGV